MNYFVRSSLKEFSVFGCAAQSSNDIQCEIGSTSKDLRDDATPPSIHTDHPSDAAHGKNDIHNLCGSTLGSEPNAAEAHENNDNLTSFGSAAKPPRPRAHMSDDIQNRTGSRPQTQRQADGSSSRVKSRFGVVRRLPRFSEDLDEWIASLSPDDAILTPFGCGSDKLIYAAQQTGCVVLCCLPKRVQGCDTDVAFFQRLASLVDPDWYTLQKVDAQRMCIKILAGVRLAIQKQRIQTGNRYGSYVKDLELLAGNPIGRTYRRWSDVMEGLHKGFHAVESEVTKSLARAVKNDPVYVKLLEPVRGIGPAIGGYLIGSILRPDRFPGIQSLWHYAGLHVEIDADGVGHAAKRHRGSCDSWNPNLKRLCCGIIPDVFQKLGGEYRDIQEERKAYEFARQPDMTKGHAHRRAWRFAVKLFLKRFWNGWREMEPRESSSAAA